MATTDKSKALPSLTRLQAQIVSHVINSIAFGEGEELVENLADEFHRQPARFLPTLRKLADMGYLQLSGETYPRVSPTARALRNWNPSLSEGEARKILRKA